MLKARKTAAILLYWAGTYSLWYFAGWARENVFGSEWVWGTAYFIVACLIICFWGWAVATLWEEK